MSKINIYLSIREKLLAKKKKKTSKLVPMSYTSQMASRVSPNISVGYVYLYNPDKVFGGL